jgi:predicted dienelactone hydrolase
MPDSEHAAPVVMWSHGLGGSRDGAAFLGEHLASHGYAAFHLQHPGTDRSILGSDGREGLLRRGRDPQAALARFGDVAFAVAQIKEMNARARYRARFDTASMGISGHSFGAITSLVAAGQQNAAVGQRFAVPELKGAFVMSPSARGDEPEQMFRDMLMPIFHLTGTRDDTPFGDFEPAARRLPFELIEGVDQYLLVLHDAVHATFSGRKILDDPALERHHALIRMAAVAFWDLYLKNDTHARSWLKEGGLAREVDDGDLYAVKLSPEVSFAMPPDATGQSPEGPVFSAY